MAIPQTKKTDRELPTIPPQFYPLITKVGELHWDKPPKDLWPLIPEWRRWVGRLWVEHKLRVGTVVGKDQNFRAWHDEHCAGCLYVGTSGEDEEGEVRFGYRLVPGEHAATNRRPTGHLR
jgi:hypothetical protein